MLAATYGNVSDIEILWTLIGLIGVLFSIYNLADAWKDRDAVVAAGIYNGRRIIANFAVRGEAAALIQSVFTTIGAVAFTQPDAPQNALTNMQHIINSFTVIGFIMCEILILFKSIDAFIVRRLLRIPPHEGE